MYLEAFADVFSCSVSSVASWFSTHRVTDEADATLNKGVIALLWASTRVSGLSSYKGNNLKVQAWYLRYSELPKMRMTQSRFVCCPTLFWTFWSNGNVLNFYYGCSYMTPRICQNSSNWILKWVLLYVNYTSNWFFEKTQDAETSEWKFNELQNVVSSQSIPSKLLINYNRKMVIFKDTKWYQLNQVIKANHNDGVKMNPSFMT